MNRKVVLRSAVAKAYRVRAKHSHGLDSPLDPIDLILAEGLEVRFDALASLEGTYIQQTSPPTILLSSVRPRGRVNFTASHELGHHAHGHGTKLDEYLGHPDTGERTLEESVADTFAAFLLMPERALIHQAKMRSIRLATISHLEAFKLACQFGVGYGTLVNHLSVALNLISTRKREDLARHSLKTMKAEYGLSSSPGEIVWIDHSWNSVPINLRIGDILLSGDRLSHHPLCEEVAHADSGEVVFAYRACATGIAQVCCGSCWSAFVRVSAPQYVGRAIHRHLPAGDGE